VRFLPPVAAPVAAANVPWHCSCRMSMCANACRCECAQQIPGEKTVDGRVMGACMLQVQARRSGGKERQLPDAAALLQPPQLLPAGVRGHRCVLCCALLLCFVVLCCCALLYVDTGVCFVGYAHAGSRRHAPMTACMLGHALLQMYLSTGASVHAWACL